MACHTISTMTTQSPPVDPASFEAWRASVATVLAKARRVGVAELGEYPERLLDTETLDGITLAALYTLADELPEPPLPGTFPFTRGARVRLGWDVRVRYGRPAGTGNATGLNATELNATVLDDLASGVTSLWLAVGPNAVAPEALAQVLDGVFLDLAPVVLDPGADLVAAAESFFAVLERSDADPAEIHAGLGADPVGVLLRTGIDLGAQTVELARRAHHHPSPLRAITVDATVFHDAGAADAQELGAALAAGVHHLRVLTDAGLDVDAALRQLQFRFAATADQFATMAKMRAWRRVWSRVAQASGGCPDAARAPQHAVTSAAMMSQRDPWVNMLRTTLAAFGAGIGGADAVTVLAFDAALPGGAPNLRPSFAARIARNTQLLLLEESHLGRVLDAGGGSFYLEQLTDSLASAAWSELQRIETDGGLLAGLRPLRERIAATAERRAADIAHRRRPLTGVSEFPNLVDPAPATTAPTESDWGLRRWAEPFERLRDRADAAPARPEVLLVPLGPVAEHAARAGFTSTFLAAGGISARDPGPLHPSEIAAVATGARVAVVCGSDRRYRDDAAPAVAALRSAGVPRVLVAGSASGWPQGEPPPDGFVGVGVDAVAVLTDLLNELGVS